jgi:hypothetical protein
MSLNTAVEDEYLTLEEAARLAGHASASTLRGAARSGRLKTVKFSPRVQLTTREWLNDYIESRWVRRDGEDQGAAAEET